MSVEQIIEGRYIDRGRLLQMLKKTFGAGNFSLRVRKINFDRGTATLSATNETFTDAVELLDLDHT